MIFIRSCDKNHVTVTLFHSPLRNFPPLNFSLSLPDEGQRVLQVWLSCSNHPTSVSADLDLDVSSGRGKVELALSISLFLSHLQGQIVRLESDLEQFGSLRKTIVEPFALSGQYLSALEGVTAVTRKSANNWHEDDSNIALKAKDKVKESVLVLSIPDSHRDRGQQGQTVTVIIRVRSLMIKGSSMSSIFVSRKKKISPLLSSIS
jgi:hypothetical protein